MERFGGHSVNQVQKFSITKCMKPDVYMIPSSNNTREDSTRGHHQMVNTEIRLDIFFAAKDGAL